MAYVKILYQDSPSTATPLNAQNLNHMDDQIALNDQRLTELEGAHVSSFNGRTGAVTPADGDYDIGQIAPLSGAQVGQVPVVTNIGTEEDPELVFKMGAGGSGGHTIQNASGANMPQEENLQFVGLEVTDDPVNGKTIVDATDKVTWEANGVLGAKNLIPNEHQYPVGTTSTLGTTTFTENEDGSITVNGTSTTTPNYYVIQGSSQRMFLKAGTYILSGCPGGGSSSTYELLMINSSDINIFPRNYGGDTSITLESDGYYGIKIVIRNGVTIDNLTFKPMLRLASDTDNTYQPYAKTNKELTDELKGKVDWATNGKLGAKNLIPYPYYETTKTVNGITFTDNGDGSVTVSGTATAFATFICHNRQNSEVNEFRVKNGSYILSGCPNGGSENTFYLLGNRTYNGSNNNLGKDVGNGVTLTLNGDDYGADGVNLGIIIEVKSGTSIPTPITFYPMLRLASDTDGTYQPYAMTNYELTKKIRELETALLELGGN